MLDDHSKNNLNVKTDRNECLLVRLKCNAVSSGNGYWEFGSGQPESPGGSQAGLQEDRRPPGCYRGWDGEWWQWGSHQQVTLAALRALYLMHTLGELLHVFKCVKKRDRKKDTIWTLFTELLETAISEPVSVSVISYSHSLKYLCLKNRPHIIWSSFFMYLASSVRGSHLRSASFRAAPLLSVTCTLLRRAGFICSFMCVEEFQLPK